MSESEVRLRNPNTTNHGPRDVKKDLRPSQLVEGLTSADSCDSEMDVLRLNFKDHNEIPQGTELLSDKLTSVHPKWRNYVIRFFFTWIMISGFFFVIWLGPIAVSALVLAIQIKCFHEIISIGYTVYRSWHLPWFRTLSWYFLFTSNYFFYGEGFVNTFGVLLARNENFLWPLVKYHRFISFSLYTVGIVWFVLSLVKKHYIKQFTLFGWTHMTLLFIVSSSHMMMHNLFYGLIWFLLPTLLIIVNDIAAYMFGFFFGRTPLIKLSPKKTWEGFIGGALATVVTGFVFSSFMVQYDFLVCPLSYSDEMKALTHRCTRESVFILKEYSLSQSFINLGLPSFKVRLYPFQLHAISFSLFASFIGPFGGFFASGFKRAFKIKDFADTIPGHGGLVDRFDCQILMAAFVEVYISSFIRAPSYTNVLRAALLLKPAEQLQLFRSLAQELRDAGILPPTT